MSENNSIEPKIVDKKPVVMTLEAGKYFWCSCGLSANQPFCNGAHKGTSFTPVSFELSESTKMPLCLCKYTAGVPKCDGTHLKLTDSVAS
ncbi:cytochrome C551 [Pseudanabaena sp. SR411]|uniref:CDGSH iron-sulfur domain-containing protein n=1 Tax=Pseudanabaena sp. SR411 TaxID=1980935 RepID=UPI000B9808B6|nr:CDGSH iron-sulfur domain-containing protein [Pseudanabaena sp. SR411]OYQ67037.1 cytochrome C551 [Pseudanabaena sp. SR411]